MAIKNIKRVTCDTCGIEEPEKYYEIELATPDSAFVLCTNCITKFGLLSGPALFEMAQYIGQNQNMTNVKCPKCEETYKLRSTIQWSRLQPQLKQFTKLFTTVTDKRD
jgi:hypothetical protein